MSTRIPSTVVRKELWILMPVALGGLAIAGRHQGYHDQARNDSILTYLFLAVGVCLLVWAIREMVCRIQFGKSFFSASADTFVLGSPLNGKISSSRPLPSSMGQGYRLTLSCVDRKESQKGNPPIWQDMHLVDPSDDGRSPSPFFFPQMEKKHAIPMKAMASSGSWRLRIQLAASLGFTPSTT